MAGQAVDGLGMPVAAAGAPGFDPAGAGQPQEPAVCKTGSHTEGTLVPSEVPMPVTQSQRPSCMLQWLIIWGSSQKEGNGISTRFYALSDMRAVLVTSVNGFIKQGVIYVRDEGGRGLTPITAGSSCTFLL